MTSSSKEVAKKVLLDLFPEEKESLDTEKSEELYTRLSPILEKFFAAIYKSMEASVASIQESVDSVSDDLKEQREEVSEISEIADENKNAIESLISSFKTDKKNLTEADKEINAKLLAMFGEGNSNHKKMERNQEKLSSDLQDLLKEVKTIAKQFYNKEHTNKFIDDLEKKVLDRIEALQRDIYTKLGNMHGDHQNFQVNIGGTIVSTRYADLNFIAGTGVTIAAVDNNTTKQADITISSTGGGSFTTLAPTETPNGSITVFTFSTATAKPTFIVSDNAMMQATTKSGTVNWTWNNGTKKATMTIPPQDDIIGIQ